MRSLFLDASGWIAATLPHEPRYAAARARLEASVLAGHRLITTSLVIAEMHAILLRRQGIVAARRFLDEAFDAQAYHVVFPDEDIVTSARTDWLQRFADQQFSLCDAVSFEVMRRERITSALATDQDFATAGFETVR